MAFKMVGGTCSIIMGSVIGRVGSGSIHISCTPTTDSRQRTRRLDHS